LSSALSFSRGSVIVGESRRRADSLRAGLISASEAMEKSPEAFRTIREVADAMDLPQHVLRF